MADLEAQVVYRPPAGRAVEAPWGEGVARAVVQKFTSVSDRNAKWTTPPAGSMCATTDTDQLWFHNKVSGAAGWEEIAQIDKHVSIMMPKTGGVFTGTVIMGNATTGASFVSYGYFNLRGPSPYIDFSSEAATPVRYGYIQYTTDGGRAYVTGPGATRTFRFFLGNPHGTPVQDPYVERFRIEEVGARVVGTLKTQPSALGAGGVHAGGDGPQLRIIDTNTKTGNADAYIGFYAKGTIDAPGALGGYIGYNQDAHMRLYNLATSSSMFLSAPYAIAWLIAGAEQARIYSGGFFVLSKTAVNQSVTGVELHPGGTVFATRADATAGLIVNKEGNVSNTGFADFRSDTVNCGLIHRVAQTAATKYRETSDGRWKGEIQTLDGGRSIEIIKQLRPVSFRWKSDDEGRPCERGACQGDVYTGFIAQELAEVVPAAVLPGEGTEDEHWAWVRRCEDRAAAIDAFSQQTDPGVLADERPQALTAEELVDPFRPWMSSASDLIPDLVSAMNELITRVEALERLEPA